MARSGAYNGFAVLGFLALGGGFALAAVAVMQPVPPPAFAKAEAGAEVAEPATMQVYVPLEEQVAVSVSEQPARVILTLGFSLRAPVEELVALQAEVEAKRPAILAALLAAAQDEVVKSADPVVLLARLPGPLRAAVNKAIGTAERPEPVEEVLVTGLVTQ